MELRPRGEDFDDLPPLGNLGRGARNRNTGQGQSNHHGHEKGDETHQLSLRSGTGVEFDYGILPIHTTRPKPKKFPKKKGFFSNKSVGARPPGLPGATLPG